MIKHVKSFLKGKELNSYDEDRILTLEITKFDECDNAIGYARNGMNDVLELVTTRDQIKSFELHRDSLYYKVSTLEREVKGMIKTKDRQTVVSMENYEDLLNIVPCNGKGRKSTLEDLSWPVSSWLRQGDFRELEDILKKYNVIVEKSFLYTDILPLYSTPLFIKQSNTVLEWGEEQSNTYNNLPMIIKFSWKKKEDKFTRLMDIGIEKAGHYSHDDRMYIANESVDAAKKFHQQFKRKMSSYENETIKRVAKRK